MKRILWRWVTITCMVVSVRAADSLTTSILSLPQQTTLTRSNWFLPMSDRQTQNTRRISVSNLTADKASTNHTHSATDVSTGTLPTARGGTGISGSATYPSTGTVITKEMIDSEAEFEALLFPLPEGGGGGGSGDDVFLNGGGITNPNFKDGTTVIFSSTSTNLFAHATNIADAQISGSANISESKLDSTLARDSEVTAAIAALSSVYQAKDADLDDVADGSFTGSKVGTGINADNITGGTQTGSDGLVRATSPTIVTPTIASMVNANHNHENGAGGGVLGAAAISDGVLTQAKMASSVFQTFTNRSVTRNTLTLVVDAATPSSTNNVPIDFSYSEIYIVANTGFGWYATNTHTGTNFTDFVSIDLTNSTSGTITHTNTTDTVLNRTYEWGSAAAGLTSFSLSRKGGVLALWNDNSRLSFSQIDGGTNLQATVSGNSLSIDNLASVKAPIYGSRTNLTPALSDYFYFTRPTLPTTSDQEAVAPLSSLTNLIGSGAARYTYTDTALFSTNASPVDLFSLSPASGYSYNLEAKVIAGAPTNKGTFKLTAFTFNNAGSVTLVTNANEHKYFWPNSTDTNALAYWELSGSTVKLKGSGYTNEQFHWWVGVTEESATNHTTTASTSNTLTNDMIHEWRMEEDHNGVSAITREDSWASADFTDINTVQTGTGKIGDAADFELSNQERFTATVNGTDLDINGEQSFSISFWAKPESPISSDQYIFAIWNTSVSKRSYAVWLQNTDDKFQFSLSGDGSTPTTASAGTAATAGTWYHVVAVFDAAADSMTLYINGASSGTATFTGGIFNNDQALTVGHRAGPTNHYDGLLDELKVWTRALSADDVSDIYDLENAGTRIY